VASAPRRQIIRCGAPVIKNRRRRPPIDGGAGAHGSTPEITALRGIG